MLQSQGYLSRTDGEVYENEYSDQPNLRKPSLCYMHNLLREWHRAADQGVF